MRVFPVEGIGEVAEGDDIAALIADALTFELVSGDVVVVTHKVVSKAEGAIRTYADEEERRAIIEAEAVQIIRRRGDLVITETPHGFVCANAGVDRSNVEAGLVVLLPRDPDRSARRIRTRLERLVGIAPAVVITDTFGRAWRQGLTDVAIGVAGIPAIVDHRGTTDSHRNELVVTQVAVADEIAAAADLVMGKSRNIPVAVVRGLDLEGLPAGTGRDLVRSPADDLFR